MAAKKRSKRVPAKPKGRPAVPPGQPRVDPGFAPVVAAFAGDRSVTLGKMLVSMGLKVDGKVFAMLSKGRFVVKLPKQRVAELVSSKKGAYFDRGDGKPMKEWFSSSAAPREWLALAREAHTYVKGK